MQASDDRRNSVRAPMWAAVVAGLHVVAVGSFFFIQGCGTPKQAVVEPPPPPVMPPRQDVMAPGPLSLPSPAFQPAAEKAPASLEAAATASYTVQNGDSLSKIAAKVGVTSREIAELNTSKMPTRSGWARSWCCRATPTPCPRRPTSRRPRR